MMDYRIKSVVERSFCYMQNVVTNIFLVFKVHAIKYLPTVAGSPCTQPYVPLLFPILIHLLHYCYVIGCPSIKDLLGVDEYAKIIPEYMFL